MMTESDDAGWSIATRWNSSSRYYSISFLFLPSSYDTQRKLASNHIEIEGLYVYALCLATLPSSENYYFLVNPAETITTNHFTVTTKRKENRKMELGDVITTVIRGQLMVTHPIKELHLRKLSLRKVEPDENFSKILEN